MRKAGLYLLADNRRAAIAALICTLLPLVMIPTSFIGAVIIGLVTLRKGYKSGLMVLAFVVLPAVSFLITKRYLLFEAFLLILLESILVWIFAIILRRTGSWRWPLEGAVLLAVLGIVGLHIAVPNVAQMWVHAINQYLNSPSWASLARMTNRPSEAIIAAYAPFATGLFAAFMLFTMFIFVILARWWEAALVERGLLRREFNRIRIDRITALVLALATMGLYWKSAWLMDLYPVLLFPFIIAGLSILHSLVVWRKEIIFLVVATYLLLLLGPIAKYVAVLLALLGFVDSWHNIRKYYLT